MSNHPKKLVELYRAFYRADSNYEISTRKAIQPLHEANNIICTCDSSIKNNPEMLRDAIAGRLAKLMQQIHGQGIAGASGRYVIGDSEERKAILEFSSYLVNNVFYGAFNADLGRFAGKQRGYLEDACELQYRLLQDDENKKTKTIKAKEV